MHVLENIHICICPRVDRQACRQERCSKRTLTRRFQGSIWGCWRQDGRKRDPERVLLSGGQWVSGKSPKRGQPYMKACHHWEEKADGQICMTYMYIYLSRKDDIKGGRDTQRQTEEWMQMRCEHWLASPASVLAWWPHFFPSLSSLLCVILPHHHPSHLTVSGITSPQDFTSLTPWCPNITFQWSLTPEIPQYLKTTHSHPFSQDPSESA